MRGGEYDCSAARALIDCSQRRDLIVSGHNGMETKICGTIKNSPCVPVWLLSGNFGQRKRAGAMALCRRKIGSPRPSGAATTFEAASGSELFRNRQRVLLRGGFCERVVVGREINRVNPVAFGIAVKKIAFAQCKFRFYSA